MVALAVEPHLVQRSLALGDSISRSASDRQDSLANSIPIYVESWRPCVVMTTFGRQLISVGYIEQESNANEVRYLEHSETLPMTTQGRIMKYQTDVTIGDEIYVVFGIANLIPYRYISLVFHYSYVS